jgi:hypothetical protein
MGEARMDRLALLQYLAMSLMATLLVVLLIVTPRP